MRSWVCWNKCNIKRKVSIHKIQKAMCRSTETSWRRKKWRKTNKTTRPFCLDNKECFKERWCDVKSVLIRELIQPVLRSVVLGSSGKWSQGCPCAGKPSVYALGLDKPGQRYTEQRRRGKKKPDVSLKEESCSGVRARRRSLTNIVIESSSLKGHGGGLWK